MDAFHGIGQPPVTVPHEPGLESMNVTDDFLVLVNEHGGVTAIVFAVSIEIFHLAADFDLA
jgi:hypothetical protein